MTRPNPSLRMLKNTILFQFEEESTYFTDKKVKQKGFKEVTAGGIIVVNQQKNADTARWGIVIKVGPEVGEDIKVGSRILIEKLMWTNGVEHEKEEYWMTNEDKILCVEDPE